MISRCYDVPKRIDLYHVYQEWLGRALQRYCRYWGQLVECLMTKLRRRVLWRRTSCRGRWSIYRIFPPLYVRPTHEETGRHRCWNGQVSICSSFFIVCCPLMIMIYNTTRDLIESLHKVGFRTNLGIRGSGFGLLAWNKAGGYYLGALFCIMFSS